MTISNQTKTFFHDVELKIKLSGEVRAVPKTENVGFLVSSDFALPSPPRSWGKTRRSLLNAGSFAFQAQRISASFPSRLDWHTTGSVDLTIAVGNLRPRGEITRAEDELVLVLPAGANEPIVGGWTVTANGHNEIYSGKVAVGVGEQQDFTLAITEMFDRDSRQVR